MIFTDSKTKPLKTKLFLVLFTCLSLYVLGNDTLDVKSSPNHLVLAVDYNHGKILKTHAFVKGENPFNDPYQTINSFSLRLGFQATGTKMWQQLYQYPVWGFGLYKGFFTNDHSQLGNPMATYAFIDLPLVRYRKLSLSWLIDFGVAFNWKKHNWFEQNYNYPIGTYTTIFINNGFKANYQVNKNFDVNVGLVFTHFSNGAVQLPNLGMNVFGPQFEIRYYVNGRPELKWQNIPEYKKEWEYVALLAPALRQVGFLYLNQNGDTATKVFTYGIISLSTGINRQISHKVKFGGGIDITYNSAHCADTMMVDGVPEKASLRIADKLMLGIYPSFELVLGKLSLVVQPGFYLLRKQSEGFQTPLTYQRVGLKYHLNDHLFAGINVRAFSFSKADYIEWIVGYRIQWQKSYR